MKSIPKHQRSLLFFASFFLLLLQSPVALSEVESETLEIDCSAEKLEIPEINPKKPFLINSTDIKKLIENRDSVSILLSDTDELMRVEYFTNHVFMLSYWRLSERAPDWTSSSFIGKLPTNDESNRKPLFRRLYDKHTVRNAYDTYRVTTEATHRLEACLERLIERETRA